MRFKSLNESRISPNDKIKDAYCDMYPDDEVGETLDPKITFEQCFMGMRNGKNFYKLIGGDSDTIVRERVFTMMSNIYHVDYEIIYNTWLGKSLSCK